MNRLKAINGHAILQRIDDQSDNMVNGILIPDIENSIGIKCIVLDVSPSYSFFNGHFKDPEIQIGDIVFIPPMVGTKIRYEGEYYIIVKETDIICIAEK